MNLRDGEYCLLGYNAVYSAEIQPSSEMNIKPKQKISKEQAARKSYLTYSSILKMEATYCS
jgi:hypothetical protein